MRKKWIIIPVLSAVFLLTLFVQPLRTFAMDVMSVFRVTGVKTIQVSMRDLEVAYNAISALRIDAAQSEAPITSPLDMPEDVEPEPRTLTDISEFTAFPVHLPKTLSDKTPQLTCVDSFSAPITVNVDAFNTIMAQLGSNMLLPDTMGTMTLNVPAALISDYGDTLLFATQMPVLDGVRSDKLALRDAILATPLISSSLYDQLSDIDVDSRDVYLPVLVGFGREVDLDGTTGYLYTLRDLQGFVSGISDRFDTGAPVADEYSSFGIIGGADGPTAVYVGGQAASDADAMTRILSGDENASVLIWTRDGVLYVLADQTDDNEMIRTAKSVR